MTKAFLKPCWVLLLMGLLVLPMVPGVFAQTPPDKRLDNLEKQIQSLQQTVAEFTEPETGRGRAAKER